MAQLVNRLTPRAVTTTKKAGRHPDGRGLYLNVTANGSKSWVFRYMFKGRVTEKGLGSFPALPLAEARELVLEYRKQLDAGVDPFASTKPVGDLTLFGDYALTVIEALRPGWKNAKHAQQWENTLRQHAASLWDKQLASITTEDVLEVLRPIWSEMPETASRVRARIEKVLDHAKVSERYMGDNPARWQGHLQVLLSKRRPETRGHHAAMPYAEVPDFIKQLQELPGATARLMELCILTAVRTVEIIPAKWEEFDLKKRLWLIPSERMKIFADPKGHRVPLSTRAVNVLKHLAWNEPKPTDYVFPGYGTKGHISNAAMQMQLRRMSLDHYTPHGFRSSFRDWAGDMTDFPREVIEAALAHAVGNKAEAAYRRSDALLKRQELMEAWAIFCTTGESPPRAKVIEDQMKAYLAKAEPIKS